MKNIHRGWIILILVTLSVLACLGFGRFSFGAILPFMKSGLDLGYLETGYVASSIFLGYLIAVVIAGHFVVRFTAKKVIIFSLILISIGMVLTSNASSFWLAFVGCFVIGLGTGGAYVPSLGLLGQWFTPKKRGMAMGIAMAGSGLGIVFSGLAVPLIISGSGVEGWRFSWYLLAVLVIVITIINLLFLKNRPEEVNLEPIGASSTIQSSAKPTEVVKQSNTVYRNKELWFFGMIYLLWGMSYLVFSTFLVDYLIVDVGFTNERAGQFFASAGISSIISGFIWGSLSDRLGRMPTLIFVFTVQFLTLLGLSFSVNSFIIFAIIVIYGMTLWAVPAIMNASVGDYVLPSHIPIAMGFVTLFFSTGQFLSPVVTGFLIDYFNTYFTAFLFSSLTALFGALGCLNLTLINKKKNIESMALSKAE